MELLRQFLTHIQSERESGGNDSHQPPYPEWWDNLPPTFKKTATQ